jgi:hypothetical protein
VRIRTTALVALAALALLPNAALGQSSGPGDSYLGAFRLNPGPPDTPQSMPRTGGPAEPNTCGAAAYARTAWGWLYTARWAQADVRASGSFDEVLAVMPFVSPRKPVLSVRGGVCVNRSTSGQEEFGADRPILAPGWYAIQVGGANDTGGPVTVSVALAPPPGVTAQVRARSVPRRGGAAVTVSVAAPKGARLAFACTRRKCRLQGARTVTRPGLSRYLSGRLIPNGARLELRVTQAGHIGAYFAWNVRAGKLGKVLARCTDPASNRPQTRCDG